MAMTPPSGATSPARAAGAGSDVRLGPERVLAGGLGFLESPRWHGHELWFSDFFSRRVSSVDLAGRLTTRYYVPGQPSGLAPLPGGDVLIASVHNGRLLRGSPDGSLRVVADVGAVYRGGLNDLVADAAGRAYLSTLPDLTGVRPGDVLRCPIILVDEQARARVVADGLRVPNGMVITPDGGTLIAAETQAFRLVKFAVAGDGSLGAPEVFAELGGRKPDGIALDPSGAVWACSPFTSEVVLVAEGGAVLASASTPGSWAVACAVGGERQDTLFAVTAEVTAEGVHQGTGTGAVRAYGIERR